MSLDAGGLAQMTYNHNTFNGGLGMPGSGFASRGKAPNIKRLSFAPPSKIPTIDENSPVQPRTSRSHLLAGLRTAPKSPTFPTSAPPTQLEQRTPFDRSRYGMGEQHYSQQAMPRTATGVSFPTSYQNQYNMSSMNQMYSPEQVLAPPAIQIEDEHGAGQMDPSLYDELVRTNQYLAQQQMRLKQQLINVTAAAQQIHDMQLNQDNQYAQLPMTPGLGFYNQQLQQGLQPIVQPVPNQPGFYTVYNPMSGQVNYIFDQNAQASQTGPPQAASNLELSHSPPPPTPTFRAQVSPPPDSPSPFANFRSGSPPKTSSPPQGDVNPLPPPSANAFRPGHRKALTLLSNGVNSPTVAEAPKTGGLRSAGFPTTPMTGTFGPGQARAGEHPIRQPRGPPALEELIAKPTTKFEGSKNFATRQRRRAVNNLVRAGLERRTASRGNGSIDSLEGLSPTSEGEIAFSLPSDNDSDGTGSRSASLSSKPSIGSLRAAANGAIGSERKELKERSRERSSVDGQLTATSVSSEEGATVGGRLVEVKVEGPKDDSERRRAPLLVLGNAAEKRRSTQF
ncbi:hypothetical protein MMC19_006113 [Ptychographa xylographoides]|nr:hypothetical protein [Ptychographa xylographoides]